MTNAQRPKDPDNLTELEAVHFPQIDIINQKVGQKFVFRVRVGVTPHVMTPEHLIMWIEAFYGNRPVGKVFLKPHSASSGQAGDEPKAEFTVAGKAGEKIKAYEFCNLHGLWVNEVDVNF
ncbi:superoxide reductase [Candidatus Shapirobacteria bacterium CG10_big_fil_rev_8_21_14_0_10_40_9]|uniref:Superoxide reductase n=1 Tax=Candidatus Shapirobacteria bacterium CG10_big_fil_rev_8_21_14_0_10_40_9 TaxID=1974888 RepID=A0A2M8L3R1_9BACT|nr:MAG: superoxide reductase [Candidatus Shapirobacteria bacterium CG10_big_fil_rev_8_21_14_0_10_40_9]